MLGKTEDKRRSGQQKMRRLDSITDSIDKTLSKLQDIKEPGILQSMGSQWVVLSDWTTTNNIPCPVWPCPITTWGWQGPINHNVGWSRDQSEKYNTHRPRRVTQPRLPLSQATPPATWGLFAEWDISVWPNVDGQKQESCLQLHRWAQIQPTCSAEELFTLRWLKQNLEEWWEATMP